LSFFCPVCNGMQPLHYSCPKCKKETEDCGRFGDYMGPYSPYRPIDDIKLTNGFFDLQNHECIHVAFCSTCDHVFKVSVDEWKE
jgi:hypothetical protein